MQVPEVKTDVKPVQKGEEEEAATPATKKKRKRVTMAEPDKEREEKGAKQGRHCQETVFNFHDSLYRVSHPIMQRGFSDYFLGVPPALLGSS